MIEIIDKEAVYNQDGRGWLVRSEFHSFIVVHFREMAWFAYHYPDLYGPAVPYETTIPAATWAYVAEPLDDGARWTEAKGRPVAGGPGLTQDQVVALIPTHQIFWCDECRSPSPRVRPVSAGIWWCDACVEKSTKLVELGVIIDPDLIRRATSNADFVDHA